MFYGFFIVLNVYENFAIHMQYNWWFLPQQVCVLLPLYLRLHQAAPVLSSHQLSIPATASDQTLSTGFMIHILVFKLGRNPCPLSCDSYNLWFKLIHLWSIILTLDPYTITLNIYDFFFHQSVILVTWLIPKTHMTFCFIFMEVW